MWHVTDAGLRREYRARVWRVLQTRRDPGLVLYYLIKCAMHYHLYTMARSLAAGRMVSTFEVTPASPLPPKTSRTPREEPAQQPALAGV
jgi:hypothetical protein